MTASRSLWLMRAGSLALAAIVVVLIPRFVGDFRALELALVPIFFVALLGLNVLTGYSGQISLGHGAFMAIGGYTTAILVSSDEGLQLLGHTFSGDMKDLFTIPLAGVVAGVAGTLFGISALRLSGLYLALVTFAVAVALPAMIKKYEKFTGGGQGIQLFAEPQYTGQGFMNVSVLGREQTFNDYMYYLCWAVAGVMFVLAWALLHGRTGRALRAIRDSEVAATSFGVSPSAYKTLAFAVSAFFAGVAGSLYAIHTTFVNPDVFPITLSITLLVGVVVGGLGSLWPLVFGAAFVVYLPKLAGYLAGREEFPDFATRFFVSPGTPSIVFGLALVLVIFVLPTGVGGLVSRVLGPLTTRLYTRS